VEYGELADILVKEAQSADEVTRMTALRWLRAFVIQAKDQLMPYYAIILAAVLPNVSHNNQDICQVRLVSELCLQRPSYLCLHTAWMYLFSVGVQRAYAQQYIDSFHGPHVLQDHRTTAQHGSPCSHS